MSKRTRDVLVAVALASIALALAYLLVPLRTALTDALTRLSRNGRRPAEAAALWAAISPDH